MTTSNILAIVTFAAVLGLTLWITYWAARRTRSATDFWAAGRGITAGWNGLAIAGDFMSAGSFLGSVGLIFLFGFDGTLILVAALFSFLPVLYLFSDRLRNVGRFTVADVLAFHLKRRQVRLAAALTTLIVAGFYLMAQLVASGALLGALAGIPYWVAVILTGVFMMIYVVFGGMLATTWVQIIKAGLLLIAGIALAVAVMANAGFSLAELLSRAAAAHSRGDAILGPGLLLPSSNPLNILSYGITYAIGTAGLPHVLIRFFTVPDATTARRSVGWAVLAMAVFYVTVVIIGFGARAMLDAGGIARAGGGGNLAALAVAEVLGGGRETIGGELAFAVLAAIAFATILAVVAGLVISVAGAVAHDIWAGIVRREQISETEQTRVARVSAAGIAIVAIVLAIGVGPSLNVTFLIGFAFLVAASANFPVLLLALSWKRFNTMGALVGFGCGAISALCFLLMTPPVWPGAPPAPLAMLIPGLITIPIGFVGCWIGVAIGERRSGGDAPEHSFTEFTVRAETGLGAEGVPAAH